MSQAHPLLSPQATQRLTLDTEPFLSCDDCFDLVDSYVEALLSDPTHDQPALPTHLAGCPPCATDARPLLCLVAGRDGRVPPRPARSAAVTRSPPAVPLPMGCRGPAKSLTSRQRPGRS